MKIISNIRIFIMFTKMILCVNIKWQKFFIFSFPPFLRIVVFSITYIYVRSGIEKCLLNLYVLDAWCSCDFQFNIKWLSYWRGKLRYSFASVKFLNSKQSRVWVRILCECECFLNVSILNKSYRRSVKT